MAADDLPLGRHSFVGHIAGVGSASGIRVVVGLWSRSPFGPFSDTMIENAAGHRILVATTPKIADFIGATYVFDEVRVEPVHSLLTTVALSVTTPSLTLTAPLGERTALGWLLRGIPRTLGARPAFAAALDPVARVVLRGVRTRGTARGGRREWYAASDQRAVTSLVGSWDGQDLGPLAPVDPPCRFGFSSTPRSPTLTSVTTTVEIGST